MLNTSDFIDRLIECGYTHICAVPCSFAKNIINEVINNNSIKYVPCASEAVACSIAVGLKMSYKQPIVIVQSSGLTNMGSCITSLLKPYNVKFSIIVSWRTYKEGDSEIQHKHLAKKLPTLIHAYGYKHLILDNQNIDNAIYQINNCNHTFTICLLLKDSFSEIKLKKEYELDLSNFIQRSHFLTILNKKFKNSDLLFIGTTGNTAREMYHFMPNTNNFYMAGNMGGALSLGLGASIGGRKVIVCGGDAEFVMHMGGLATAGRYNNNNIDLTYILFDNKQNKSTGGQNTYQDHLSYIDIAKNSNFITNNNSINTLDDFEQKIENNKRKNGLRFLHVECGTDDEATRPPIQVIKVNKFE